jgi:hypothetical protein
VIVGAEAVFATEISSLLSHWHSTGRLSVDDAVDPPVDQLSLLRSTNSRFPIRSKPAATNDAIENTGAVRDAVECARRLPSSWQMT